MAAAAPFAADAVGDSVMTGEISWGVLFAALASASSGSVVDLSVGIAIAPRSRGMASGGARIVRVV